MSRTEVDEGRPTPRPASIRLADGRALAYTVFGRSDGFPVIYHHGSPSSRLSAGLLADAAERARVALVSVDRPGIGGSDGHPSRRIGDWPGDLISLLDQLGYERVALLGVSVGAAYVYACCKAWPDRIAGATVISGIGPPSALTGIRPDAMRVVLRISPSLAARLFTTVANRARSRRATFTPPGSSPADVAALTDPAVREIWLAGMLEAYRAGPSGVVKDQTLALTDWGFPLDAVRVPVRLWHGEADRIVPLAVARRVAQQLATSRLTILPGDGHLSALLNHGDEILGQLVADISRNGPSS